MTNPNKTLIVVLLDKSGSMGSVRAATIEGINSFIESQRKVPGEAQLHMVQFDDFLETTYSYAPLTEVQALDFKSYQPRGGTSLLEAISEVIDSVGTYLTSLAETERPGRVNFVIQTDGQENSSDRTKYSYEGVAAKIKHQTEAYGWDFTFLGANQDAIATASTFGISAGKALSYNGSDKGTRQAFETLGGYMSLTRSVDVRERGLVSYSDTDRDANQ